jgi:uncharacterized protein YsxB (DUF464 family)
MIEIDAVLDEEGLLKSCDISGHAGAGPKGGDIVCAAVSVLARTALKTLSGRPGITVRGEAPQRGVFHLEAAHTQAGREFLRAAGTFLIDGLESVSGEYPGYCRIRVMTSRS